MTVQSILIVGGPADGLRVHMDPKERIYKYVHNDQLHNYAIGTIQGAFHDVFYVGVQNLNDCVICALLAGYRKPVEHHTDLNVAEQLVTFLGGTAGGRQMAVPQLHNLAAPDRLAGDTYHIVPVICKDGRAYRVGVLDPISDDPIKLLYQGYRK